MSYRAVMYMCIMEEKIVRAETLNRFIFSFVLMQKFCDISKKIWLAAENSNLAAYTNPLAWWRHQMEIFSALLAHCAGNSPITSEFPSQRPVTRSFDVFFDLRLNKRLSKQSRDWWLETPSRPLWRHSNCLRSVTSEPLRVHLPTPSSSSQILLASTSLSHTDNMIILCYPS